MNFWRFVDRPEMGIVIQRGGVRGRRLRSRPRILDGTISECTILFENLGEIGATGSIKIRTIDDDSFESSKDG